MTRSAEKRAPRRRSLVVAVAAALLAAGVAGGVDAAAPAAVTDLRIPALETSNLTFDAATGELSGVPIVLVWTAPGMDGSSGQAWRYDLRFGLGEITEETWHRTAAMGNPALLPLPSPAGQPEVHAFLCLRGLRPATRYSVALRTYDETGQASPVSNVVAITTPGIQSSFEEKVPLGGMALYAWGLRVDGDEAVCRYENSTLYVNERSRPYLGEETYPSGAELADRCGEATRFRELMAQGVGRSEAALRLQRERHDLLAEANRTLQAEGSRAAMEFLGASPLVERVDGAGLNGVRLRFQGEAALSILSWPEENTGIACFEFHTVYTGIDQARAAVEWIRNRTASPQAERAVAILARGGMLFLTGANDTFRFQRQLDYLSQGHPLELLPDGPLSAGPAREFLDAARHGTD